MTPSINLIPAARLTAAQYIIWQPLEETWSQPISYAEAAEAAARDPELQACAIMPDGTSTAPVPFAEIYKRAAAATAAPRDLETAAAMRRRANAIHAQRARAAAPDTTTTRAARLFIIWFIVSLYASGAGLLILGIPGAITNGNALSITFTILGALILTAAIASQRYAKKK